VDFCHRLALDFTAPTTQTAAIAPAEREGGRLPATAERLAGSFRGQWEGPGVAQDLLALKDAIRAAGKHCGVLATSHENLRERSQQGFRMLGLGIDSGLLLRSLHGALTELGRDRTIVPALTAERELPPAPCSPVAGNPS
jgi:hypothetical protein